jgi:hypothetical protein
MPNNDFPESLDKMRGENDDAYYQPDSADLLNSH